MTDIEILERAEHYVNGVENPYINQGIYDFTVSGIDMNGYQYYSGMLEPERLDSDDLRCGKAFHFSIYHKKQQSQLYTFEWQHGAPGSDWKLIHNFKDEIIDEIEVPKLLRAYGLISGAKMDSGG